MAKVTACDCCGSTTHVMKFRVGPEGFTGVSGSPAPEFQTADLCGSCVVALRFKWNELRGGRKVASA